MTKIRSSLALLIITILMVLFYIIKAFRIIFIKFIGFSLILFSIPIILVCSFLDKEMTAGTLRHIKKNAFNDDLNKIENND